MAKPACGDRRKSSPLSRQALEPGRSPNLNLICGFSPKTRALPLDNASKIIMLVAKRRRYLYLHKGANMQAYCLKCRTKREMRNPQSVTLKNGRPATQGACPVCGTKMYRIGKG